MRDPMFWQDPFERWEGVERPYSAKDVEKLRGSLYIENTLALKGSEKLWQLLKEDEYVTALGAVTGNQAIQMAKAGLRSIYLSGWQTAGDANTAGEVYPDQSLYPVNSGPELAKRINRALIRLDQIYHAEDNHFEDCFLPIVADAEAGFGGVLNVFELVKAYIEAGVAGIHLEDQLSSAKKCGHMGGKVLIPTQQAIDNLVAARLAADVLKVPTIIIARTDAMSSKLLTSDIDARDTGSLMIGSERTKEGFYVIQSGLGQAISRAKSYAPYCDLIWFETGKPDLEQAKKFAERIHHVFPGKMLAYNCSPSFNWKKHLDDATIAKFQRELGAMGYKFQFITLAGFHALNYGMFDLADKYRDHGMEAYVELQEWEFIAEERGYTATKHQQEVGAGYFDEVTQIITGGTSSTTSMQGSTEEEQFERMISFLLYPEVLI